MDTVAPSQRSEVSNIRSTSAEVTTMDTVARCEASRCFRCRSTSAEVTAMDTLEQPVDPVEDLLPLNLCRGHGHGHSTSRP